MLRLFSIFCLSLTAATATLWADPLDRHRVPSSAVWLIHLDVDAARDSVIGKHLRAIWLADPNSRAAIEKARAALGLDLLHGIHDITIYGTDYLPDNGVLIARMNVNHQLVEQTLKNLPGYRSDQRDGHTIYFWHETAPERRHESTGTFVGDDQIIIAPNSAMLMAQVAVMEGRSECLPVDAPILADAPPGSLLQASARGLSEAKTLPIQSPIVRQCTSGSFVAGEQHGQFFVSTTIVTESEDCASRVSDLMAGARAMAQFQHPDDSELTKLLRPLKISADGKTVHVQWQYPSEELADMLQSLRARAMPAATQPSQAH